MREIHEQGIPTAGDGFRQSDIGFLLVPPSGKTIAVATIVAFITLVSGFSSMYLQVLYIRAKQSFNCKQTLCCPPHSKLTNSTRCVVACFHDYNSRIQFSIDPVIRDDKMEINANGARGDRSSGNRQQRYQGYNHRPRGILLALHDPDVHYQCHIATFLLLVCYFHSSNLHHIAH
jgi:hypothetical protein